MHAFGDFGNLLENNLDQAVVLVITLVNLECGIAIVSSLDGVTLGLSGLNILGSENGTQFLFYNIGLDLSVGNEASLLKETVGEALNLAINFIKLAIAQCKTLLLGDPFLLNAGQSIRMCLGLLLIRQLYILCGKDNIKVRYC